jgi:hypothetical protein
MSFAWLFSGSARHFVRTKPFSLANACSSSAFCCSWCRCA